MTVRNGYITLADFKTQLDDTSTADDTAYEQVIERASRQIDEYTQRSFIPVYDTLEFDTPTDRELWFWNVDLLEAATITNGSYGALSASDYSVIPRNQSPAVAVKLVPSSSIFWETDTNADSLNAISVAGFWGYRKDYSREGWVSAGTVAVLSADTTLFVTTPENALAAGEIAKVDSELVLVTSSDTAGAVVTRGWNGSTAATHLAGATIYKWAVEPVVAQATMLQAQRLRKRKDAPFGIAGAGALGQVITISDLDPDVKLLLRALVRGV